MFEKFSLNKQKTWKEISEIFVPYWEERISFKLGARKIHFLKYNKFFWEWVFFIFELTNLPPEMFYFLKHRKSFFLRKYKKVLNLCARKIDLSKYKKNFLLKKYEKKILSGFFRENIINIFRENILRAEAQKFTPEI